MIIWGLRSLVRLLVTFRQRCQRCGQESAHRLVRSRRFFSLFFVPVIPLHTRYVVTCTYCGAAGYIPKEEAHRILGSVQQPAPAPAAAEVPAASAE